MFLEDPKRFWKCWPGVHYRVFKKVNKKPHTKIFSCFVRASGGLLPAWGQFSSFQKWHTSAAKSSFAKHNCISPARDAHLEKGVRDCFLCGIKNWHTSRTKFKFSFQAQDKLKAFWKPRVSLYFWDAESRCFMQVKWHVWKKHAVSPAWDDSLKNAFSKTDVLPTWNDMFWHGSFGVVTRCCSAMRHLNGFLY